jgi:NAD(P)-dependent dehydrogenase (short-subunit alcohol dehydrogenase family)
MTDFTHLGETIDAAVIGASGGLGRAFVAALSAMPGIARVHALSRSGAVPGGANVVPGTLDVTDEASVEAAAKAIGEETELRLVICAVGMLHAEDHFPEKTWRDLTPEGFARSYAVNATGPALVAKHFLPLIPRRERAVFAALSARVGSISDNKAGGWYSYRASKAALNQILKCLAIEEGRRRKELVITGLQPGTVATPLSEPFRGFVKDEDLFDPDEAAGHLLGVLSRLGPEHSGRFYDWKGEEFPP